MTLPNPMKPELKMAYGVQPGRPVLGLRHRTRARFIAQATALNRHAHDPGSLHLTKPRPIRSRIGRHLPLYQAVLDVGAVSDVTFAKFRQLRWTIRGDPLVCRTVGGHRLELHRAVGPGAGAGFGTWCVWNEPNSNWIGGGLSFDQYLPHLRGRGRARHTMAWNRTLGGAQAAHRRPHRSRLFSRSGSTGSGDSSTRSTTRSSGSSTGTATATGASTASRTRPRDPAGHRALMMGLVSSTAHAPEPSARCSRAATS